MVPSDYPYIIRYNGDNGLKALSMSSDPFLHLKAGNDNTAMDIHTNLAGSYNVENVLAACTVGQHFGIGEEDIVNAINGYYPQNNRSQIIKTDRNTIFMDAYNANPSSMAAAIHEFLSAPGLKKMLILGEMREVGDASDKEHEEIVDLLKNKSISSVICVGKAFQKACAAAGFTYTESVDQLNQLLAENPLNGYFIFVKGSRSNRLEKVIPLL
jgi:UDP-N-acetylmuramoyl-tripeptide--D-alanyl-D-alanine ligase